MLPNPTLLRFRLPRFGLYSFPLTVVCTDYHATRVTATCFAGQSKFKVYPSTQSATRTSILAFAVFKIRVNDRKYTGIQCTGIKEQRVSTRYLAEEVLLFLPEGHKRLVLIMIGRLRTP